MLYAVIAAMLLSACSASLKSAGYSPAHKIAPGGLKDDVVLLHKIFEADHPSLYWYTSKDSIDAYFKETLGSIHDSLTEMQFRSRLSWLVAKIHCGHTSVRSSKEYARYFTHHRIPQFPLEMKVWGDSMVVTGNAIRTDTVFKRGTVITSINGMPGKMLIDSLCQFISTDGYADNFKYQLLSIYFPLFYNLSFGLSNTNVITYIDKSGIEKTAILQNYRPVKDTTHKQVNIAIARLTRRQLKEARKRNGNNLSFDSSNTAYLQLVTFSGKGLRQLFRNSFEKIKERKARNLVIDLRANSGGNIGAGANLTRYLADSPFTVADSVSAITHNLKYSRYIHPALVYKMMMALSARKKADGRYHFGYLEHHKFNPKKSLHFNGNIYIIQGGFTFSAASMFVSHLKGQSNVTIIGEESGGGNYGNSSVHLPSIVLPNSHLQIVLPVYRIVNDGKRLKDGRGITPDIYVPPSSDAIRRGIDPKMQKVRELIKERKNNTAAH